MSFLNRSVLDRKTGELSKQKHWLTHTLTHRHQVSLSFSTCMMCVPECTCAFDVFLSDTGDGQHHGQARATHRPHTCRDLCHTRRSCRTHRSHRQRGEFGLLLHRWPALGPFNPVYGPLPFAHHTGWHLACLIQAL